jgi:NADH-quinone oxidoreductase subunit E
MHNIKDHGEEVPKNLLEALQEARDKSGQLSDSILAEVAALYNVPLSYAYGVASFYSFLKNRSTGRNVIRICQSLPCYLKNGQLIAEAIADEIGCRPGDTTADGKFSFELTNCIGLCDGAPAMLINNDPHAELTRDKISKILQSYE